MIARRIIRSLLLASVAALSAGGTAKADIVYDFVSQGSATGQYGLVPLDVGFQLTLYDDFVPESFDRQCYETGCIGTGNFSTFSLAIFVRNGDSVLGNGYNYLGEIDRGGLSYDSGNLIWDTATVDDVSLSFSQGVWTATVNNDSIASDCGQPGCTVSGTFSSVPEPASLGILAAGMVGVAVARRRITARAS